jgi:periplasmic protein TonB
MLLPVERGEVPKVTQKVFLPPTPQPHEAPQIALPTGLEDMPQIAPNMPIGLPSGVIGTRSLGPGVGRGVGPGNGNNVGPRDGQGPGDTPGIGIGGQRQRLSALPQVLWKIEPEYSEEARKVRHQGTVMLALEVGSDGRPKNIRVVRSLGLGLDERAIEAVSQWRFKPGVFNGRPVSAPVSVEVSFRLL